MKAVSYCIVSLTLMLSISGLSYSQGYTLYPTNCVVEWNGTGFHDLEMHITNHDTTDLILACTKLQDDQDSGMILHICLNGYCEMWLPAQDTLNPIMPDSTGQLRIHCTAPTLGTKGTVKYFLYEASNPGVGDTITYLMNQSVSLESTSIPSEITVFPNPATDWLNVDFSRVQSDNEVKIEIFGLNGVRLSQEYRSTGAVESLPLKSLSQGTYILYCTFSDGRTLIKRFEKRGI